MNTEKRQEIENRISSLKASLEEHKGTVDYKILSAMVNVNRLILDLEKELENDNVQSSSIVKQQGVEG